MFCFACRMFGVKGLEKGKENWIIKGVTGAYWKNGIQRIPDHSVSHFHISSITYLKIYLLDMPIDCQLNQQKVEELDQREKEIVKNSQVLSHFLDILRFFSKQNLAFRGHDETCNSFSKGNFLELVNHQAKYDHNSGAPTKCWKKLYILTSLLTSKIS